MIGRVFNNRYQITERIGIGGMAEVYRAQDNVLGRLVAVKVMLPQYAADPNFTQRFKQEAAAAANLQSPYIVNVYDWGQDEGTYYIVMEFVRGSDLKTAIIERGAINQRKVAEIGSQVCQALSVAHGLDIIHRDIKPQNIMVQPDGNVKVMDFGIARAKNSVMTQTSSVLGTAHYISPEQAQGKDLTATSDIYSLGIVLYESATGRLPFDGPDAVSVAMKQVNDLPVPPREINPDIDPALEAIIMKAIAKNPEERFATAKDMRLALNDYLAGRPVNLGEGFTSAETVVMGGVVPPIGSAVADGTAVMPAMGGVKPAASTAGQRSYNSNNTGGKKNNKKTIAIVIGIIAALAVVGGIAFALMSGGGDDKDLVAVPNVVGQTVDEATAAIEGAGFELGKVDESFDDSVESGQVINQDPKGDSKQAKGTKINLTVSKGTQEITVPDLSNMTADEAQKALTVSGLKYAKGAAEYSDTVEKDRVARQDIAAGEAVAKDTVVTFYLSLGSEGIEVPNVVGMSLGNAIATINNLDLLVNEDYTYQNSDQPEDTVLSQTPSSGTLKKGGVIALTLSKGPEKKSFTVAVNSNGGGSVTTSSNSVTEGDSVTITITPNSGYEVASVRGLDDVPKSGGTFTLSNIANDVNVNVTFQEVATTPTQDPDPSTTDDKTTTKPKN